MTDNQSENGDKVEQFRLNNNTLYWAKPVAPMELRGSYVDENREVIVTVNDAKQSGNRTIPLDTILEKLESGKLAHTLEDLKSDVKIES